MSEFDLHNYSIDRDLTKNINSFFPINPTGYEALRCEVYILADKSLVEVTNVNAGITTVRSRKSFDNTCSCDSYREYYEMTLREDHKENLEKFSDCKF